ncbi:MAG: four helix bundle protein [Thiohalocapsa sp. PB-PSB1]|nr:MAG: four helix bundle protein [Thiohalocapsa sp. PB-PSB1]
MRIVGAHRRRASQAIALNIAEGNGKATSADRRRSFEIAQGFALECAAIQDVLAGVRSVVRRRQQQAKGTARWSCGRAHEARTAWLSGQRGAWRIAGWSVRYRRRYRYRRR